MSCFQMASDFVLLVISVCVRVVAMAGNWFLTRPEVATPLNSWLRLTEGVHMYKSGIMIHTCLPAGVI